MFKLINYSLFTMMLLLIISCGTGGSGGSGGNDNQTENSLPEFTVSNISGNTSEEGDTANFEVGLTKQPSGTVVLAMASSDDSEGAISSETLTFNPSNWNINQTVTITGIDDVFDDGNKPYQINFTNVTSADDSGSINTPEPVEVINSDNEYNWTYIDGNTKTGLNSDSESRASYPRLIAHQSKLYATWTEDNERSQVFLAEWDGNSEWQTIQNGGTLSLNRNSEAEAERSSLQEFDNKLYATWMEESAQGTQIRVAEWQGGNSWIFVDGDADDRGINKEPTHNATGSHLAVVNDKLYAIWIEESDQEEQVRVAEWDGGSTWSFIDGDEMNQGINKNSDKGVRDAQLVDYNSTLFAVWSEYDGVNNGQIRIARWNGNTNDAEWQFVDGDHNEFGINKSKDHSAAQPKMVAHQSQLFAIWQESNLIRVAKWDGDSTWNFVDGDSTNDGLNKDSTKSASDPMLVVHDSQLYAAWIESAEAGTDQLMIARWDGADTWNFADGNGNSGINFNIRKNAASPFLFSSGSKLFTAWKEGFFWEGHIRVAVDDCAVDTGETHGVIANSAVLTLSESGDPEIITIKLNIPPTSNVTFDITSSNPDEGTVAPSTIVFTPENWQNRQILTLSPVNNNVDGENPHYTLVFSSSSNDPSYNNLSFEKVLITNSDDDTAGFDISQISGSTAENGGSATFNVKLVTQPIADVIIGVSSSDTGEGTVSPSSLVFTAENWQDDQLVTVTGVDDDIADDKTEYTIVLDKASSADLAYDELDPADVDVLNSDAWEVIGQADIAETGVGQTIRLEFGQNNVPSIAYYNHTEYVRVKTFDENETIWKHVGGTSVSSGYVRDLSFDLSSGNIPVVGLLTSDSKLSIKRFNATSDEWEYLGQEVFATGVDTTELAISPSDEIYLAYTQNSSVSVRKFNSPNWDLVGSGNIDSLSADNLDLAFDKEGVPYISYSKDASGMVVKRYNADTASWEQVGDNLSSTSVRTKVELTFDSNGTPYVIFNDNGVRVKKFNGDTWDDVGNGVPTNLGSTPETTLNIAISSNGTPYITHMRAFNKPMFKHSLKVYRLNSTSNEWETAGALDFIGETESFDSADIAFDHNDKLYLLYARDEDYVTVRQLSD